VITVNGFSVLHYLPVTTLVAKLQQQRQQPYQQPLQRISNFRLLSSISDASENDNTNNKKQQKYSIIDTSSYDYYDEHKPRRSRIYSSTITATVASNTATTTRSSSSSPLPSWKSKVNPWNDWGVERQQHQQQTSLSSTTESTSFNIPYSTSTQNPQFPYTFNDLADAVVTTCVGVLYNTASLDPNIVQNAYVGSNDIYRHRPTHTFPKDTSRIGIEIDNPSFLQHTIANYNKNQYPSSTTSLATSTSNEQSLRHLSLLIASKFSITNWNFDNDNDEDNTNSNDDCNNHQSPVFVYYNTVQQALYASQQLQRLKTIERYELSKNCINKSQSEVTRTKYDNIIILSLQDPLPIHLLNKNTKSNPNHKKRYRTAKQKRMKFQKSSNVDPSKGIVVIVQPADYNYEQQQQQQQQQLAHTTESSHSSTIRISSKISNTAASSSLVTTKLTKQTTTITDAITNVQCIAATAAVQQIPVIMISPRFIQQQQINGRDQSGYQQSSIYGGYEPPDGPTPWLLRDFSPPSLCWIGNALQSSLTSSIPLSSSSSMYAKPSNDCTYSRVSLFQSVLYPGHSWHLFAAKEGTMKSNNNNNNNDRSTNVESSYEYLCSTRKASGRPTRDVLRRLFYEFASYNK
jgi:hypothetical protein